MRLIAPTRGLIALAAAAWLPLACAHGEAALPIELEVAVQKAAPFGAMQEWGKLLAGMDLARVRLRGANAGDEPSLKTSGAGGSKRYRLVGILNHRDELILPGRVRFGQGDQGRLKKFLEELPERTEEAGVERGMFGLTKPQFAGVFADLSKVVDAPIKGVKLRAAVTTITEGLATPVSIDADAEAILKRAGPIAVELKNMSTGAALAMALRPAGLALVPEARGVDGAERTAGVNPAARLVLRIARSSPDVQAWPVGWAPEGAARQVVPAMYQFRTIEIEGFTLAKALEALAVPFGAPIFFDERTLAALAIDPAKVDVKFPAGKTYLRRAVDRILSQARLSGEVRVDEAGRPFYWVTQFGKDSPRATK